MVVTDNLHGIMFSSLIVKQKIFVVHSHMETVYTFCIQTDVYKIYIKCLSKRGIHFVYKFQFQHFHPFVVHTSYLVNHCTQLRLETCWLSLVVSIRSMD